MKLPKRQNAEYLSRTPNVDTVSIQWGRGRNFFNAIMNFIDGSQLRLVLNERGNTFKIQSMTGAENSFAGIIYSEKGFGGSL